MKSSLFKFSPIVELAYFFNLLFFLTYNHHIELVLKKSQKTVINLYFGCCHCKEILLFTLMKDLDRTASSSEMTQTHA